MGHWARSQQRAHRFLSSDGFYCTLNDFGREEEGGGGVIEIGKLISEVILCEVGLIQAIFRVLATDEGSAKDNLPTETFQKC